MLVWDFRVQGMLQKSRKATISNVHLFRKSQDFRDNAKRFPKLTSNNTVHAHSKK
jgi:hypothetical protein